MKTGFDNLKSNFKTPEHVQIIYFILEAILKRCSNHDMDLYCCHNSLGYSEELTAASVRFNLLSEYGVGVELKTFILDLAKDDYLDRIKYKDNIYYQELVKLSSYVMSLLREKNFEKQSRWYLRYTLGKMYYRDKIFLNREQTLNLLNCIPTGIECQCNFCYEFSRYFSKEKINLNQLIRETISGIF